MSKKVCVLFTDYPLGTNKTAEKLRMTLGLTLSDENEVSLVFLGDSRHALGALDEGSVRMSPVGKHLQMIEKMKGKIFMESGWSRPVADGISPKSAGMDELRGMVDSAAVLLH